MTSPRVIVAGATTAITRRTTLRKAFLGPWDPLVQQCWLYALADAQRQTGVAIHHGVLVVNHEHLTVTPSEDNLPEFVRRLHRDVSCAINTLLIAQRYDAPRELFDKRAAHCQRLCDHAAQAIRLVYDHVNCVAAGLVERPEHMPGSVFGFSLWSRGYLDVRRPEVFFSQDERARPEVIRMQVTPPPLLYEAFDGDMEKLVYWMTRLSEEATQRVRSARTRPALGARAVTRLHPWSEPRSLREPGGRRIPSFSIGARGADGHRQNIQASLEVRAFRTHYREVRLRRRAGGQRGIRARFPFGTYAMRAVHGAPTEETPAPDAIVTQPGPLLSHVQTRLREVSAPSERRVDLLDSLRAQLAQDSRSFDASACTDFVSARAEVTESARDVRTSHRFARGTHDPADQAGPDAARRLIVLRDRRMGRPARKAPRHSADPPV